MSWRRRVPSAWRAKYRRWVVDEFTRIYGARSPETSQWAIDEFARIYEARSSETWFGNTFWDGVSVQKVPSDLWVYQEILFETRPTLIVETGTMHGGSALYLVNLLERLGEGRVVTIDIEHREGRPEHQRIEYITGSSTDPAIVARVKGYAQDTRTMVILDSDHSREHVFAELNAYAGIVSPGCYLVVEDTDINGHPIHVGFGPGPWEAVAEFLPDPRFEIDRSREKFMHTSNPGGYLRRLNQ
jgi:cephalosporin hydroxylase